MSLTKIKLLGSLSACVVGVMLATSAVSGAADNEADDRNADARLGCDISVAQGDTSIILEPFVISKEPIEGSYRFLVSKAGSGSAQIDQSGLFFTDRATEHRLGLVKLGATGGSYRAKLEIKTERGSVVCTERVTGDL